MPMQVHKSSVAPKSDNIKILDLRCEDKSKAKLKESRNFKAFVSRTSLKPPIPAKNVSIILK